MTISERRKAAMWRMYDAYYEEALVLELPSCDLDAHALDKMYKAFSSEAAYYAIRVDAYADRYDAACELAADPANDHGLWPMEMYTGKIDRNDFEAEMAVLQREDQIRKQYLRLEERRSKWRPKEKENE